MMNKGFLIAAYRTFGSPKSRHAGESVLAGEKDDIEGHVSYVDQIAIRPGNTSVAIYNMAISLSKSKPCESLKQC